jgi:hypothetical protein
MSKTYLFAVMLLAASLTGCIEEADDIEKSTTSDEEKANDEETLKPVGEDNMSSLEKRVSDLETKIAEYELPKVYFLEFNGDDIWTGDYSTNLADDGNLFCMYYEYLNENRCLLVGIAYDVNGIITAVSWESSESGTIEGSYGSTYATNDYSMSYMFGIAPSLNVCDVEIIEPVNQTLSITVYDNDGNSASASYELDYFNNCRNDGPSGIPEISFWVVEGSDGVYEVDVISVSERYDLSDYSFFLKDGSGSTYTGAANAGFGEIAMQYKDGEEKGIDMNYGGDDEGLQSRAANVSADDGEDFPVHFSDNDRDGKLSAGDQFLVYGGENGPAEDGWKLDIWFELSGDIVGSAELL